MMTQLRLILIHMNASPRSLDRLRLAHALAMSPPDGPKAWVTARYGVVPVARQYPASGMACQRWWT